MRNIKKIIIMILLILVIIISILMLNKSNSSNNVEVYKRLDYQTDRTKKIKLTKKNQNIIKKYLKKEDLKETKHITNCIGIGMYIVKFGNYKITFDNTECGVTYLHNLKNDDSYQIDITSDLKKYVIDIVNKGGK